MGSKHRKQGERAKRIALISAASATATCLTVGAAPPPPVHHEVSNQAVALTASTGPNYTELIEAMSNSTNNLLFASSNFQNAVTGFTNPIASASGGLLPVFNSSVSQTNIATLQGLLDVLAELIANPNLNNIPGLPAGSLTTILDALAPGLAPVTGTVVPVLGNLTGTLSGTLAALSQVVTLLGNVNGAIGDVNALLPAALKIPSITGIVDLNNLLGNLLGINGSLTQYQSSISWPFLGVSGSTNVDNTFVQLPSLTLQQLVNNVLGSVTIPNTDLGGLGLSSLLLAPLATALNLPSLSGGSLNSLVGTAVGGLLNPVLAPLNGVATPSVTAWLPSASGNYTLPLGGSLGYLATMPTIAIGPLSSLTGGLLPNIDPDLIDLNSETVLAIPLFAGGVTLPLGLASLATVGTPGILFPTATGLTTIGGASVTALNLFGLPVFTNTNLQLANYYGTNGFDWSNGTNIATVLGIPLVYSLGSLNVGDNGFGFTGPSLFGVGLIPPFQVGSAPEQESSDGLVGKDVLNALFTTVRTASPTQATSVTQLLGLPDVGAAASPVVGALYSALVTPLATQLTAFLNANAGNIVNGGANGFEQLTAAIEKLSESLPGAAKETVPPAGSQTNAQAQTLSAPVTTQAVQKQAVVDPTPTVTDTPKVTTPTLPKVTDLVSTDPIKNVQNEVRSAQTKITTDITAATAKTKASVAKATADIQSSVKKTSDSLNKIAKEGQDQVKKAVGSVQKSVSDAADNVKKATEKKTENKAEKAKSDK